jgi:fluoride exporter
MKKGWGKGMTLVLAIAFAGALGTLARFGVGSWMLERTGTAFPWGTLLINIVGSITLAFVWGLTEAGAARPELRTVVGVGFCGAFTTFSTFSFESARLMQQGHWNRAALYTAASVLLALAGTFAGFQLAAVVLRRTGP